MGKPLSMDLRSRSLAAVDEGMSCRAAARRFGVAAATVIRWHDRRRSTGGYAAKAQGGDTRSGRIEAHARTIVALHEARRDITLDELRREVGQRGMSGTVAPMVLDGPINGDWFEAHVAQVPVPDLRQGDVVVMDNPSSHKRVSVGALTVAGLWSLIGKQVDLFHPQECANYLSSCSYDPD